MKQTKSYKQKVQSYKNSTADLDTDYINKCKQGKFS